MKLDFNLFSENIGAKLLENNRHYLEYVISDEKKYGKLHIADERYKGNCWEVNFKFWAESLPYMIQIMDQHAEIKVTDLLNIFQSILDELMIKYQHIHLYMKPFATSRLFSSFLYQLFNVDSEFIKSKLNTPQKLKQYYLIQKKRGTISGIANMVNLLFHINCRIHEQVSIKDQFPRLLLPFEPSPEMVFEVCIEKEIGEIEELKKIIEMVKPVGKICVLTIKTNNTRIYKDCIL